MKMTIARLLFLCVSLLTGIRSLQAGVEQGWDFYKEHDYQRAASEFEKAIDSGHDEAATREGLGWCYYWLGRYDSAEEEFIWALTIEPTLAGASKGLSEVNKWRYLQFNNAWQLFYNQDYSTALAVFQQILDDQTNRLPAGKIWQVHSGMGWCHYYLNNFSEAEKLFRNILNIYKGNEHALKGLGFTQYRLGQYEDAAKTLLQALDKHPEWSDTRSILGWTYYSQQQFQDARQTFEQALSGNSDYSDALYGLAWASFKLNDDSAAHDLFYRAVGTSPFHPGIYDLFTIIDKTESWWDLYNQIGWSYYKNGDYSSAEKTFTAGLKRLSDNPNLLRGLGFCQFKLGDYPAVIELLKNIDETDAGLKAVVETGLAPDGTEYTIRSNISSVIAWCKYYGGAIEEAAMLFRENLEIHGDWTDLHTGLAWCALKVNDLDTAETHLNNALKLNPSYTVALQGKQEMHIIRYTDFNAAWNSFYSGSYLEAEKGFASIVTSGLKSIDAEDYWQVFSGLGSAQLALNKPEKAVDSFANCLESDEDNPYCLSGKARGLLALNKPDEAEKLIKIVLKIDPSNAAYQTLIGWIYLKQNKYSKAKTAFSKAVDLHAGEADAHAGLGWIKFQKGSSGIAKEYFQAALSIDPDNIKALEGMKNLRSKNSH
ncbi:tetratricopeptide repeat protein [bacterium]|nr:tetratricopeptide repeat protein [bacterium]